MTDRLPFRWSIALLSSSSRRRRTISLRSSCSADTPFSTSSNVFGKPSLESISLNPLKLLIISSLEARFGERRFLKTAILLSVIPQNTKTAMERNNNLCIVYVVFLTIAYWMKSASFWGKLHLIYTRANVLILVSLPLSLI